MFELSLKLSKRTRATLDKKLKDYSEGAKTKINEGYLQGQIRSYVSLIAKAAYTLGQQDIKLPVSNEEEEETKDERM